MRGPTPLPGKWLVLIVITGPPLLVFAGFAE